MKPHVLNIFMVMLTIQTVSLLASDGNSPVVRRRSATSSSPSVLVVHHQPIRFSSPNAFSTQVSQLEQRLNETRPQNNSAARTSRLSDTSSTDLGLNAANDSAQNFNRDAEEALRNALTMVQDSFREHNNKALQRQKNLFGQLDAERGDKMSLLADMNASLVDQNKQLTENLKASRERYKHIVSVPTELDTAKPAAEQREQLCALYNQEKEKLATANTERNQVKSELASTQRKYWWAKVTVVTTATAFLANLPSVRNAAENCWIAGLTKIAEKCAPKS